MAGLNYLTLTLKVFPYMVRDFLEIYLFLPDLFF